MFNPLLTNWWINYFNCIVFHCCMTSGENTTMCRLTCEVQLRGIYCSEFCYLSEQECNNDGRKPRGWEALNVGFPPFFCTFMCHADFRLAAPVVLTIESISLLYFLLLKEMFYTLTYFKT